MHADCQHLMRRLHAFLDGECDEGWERALRAHLADCPPCLRRADFERQLRVVVATRCRQAAPPVLRERLVRMLPPWPQG
jgi:anti-sigma factor (TIGR02949 family)